MPLRRSSMTMKCSCAPLTRGSTRLASSPIRTTASRKWQCACTSMVLMRLPLTITGRRCPSPCWAHAASRGPQLQKTMPVAAPAPLRKSLRVFMSGSQLTVRPNVPNNGTSSVVSQFHSSAPTNSRPAIPAPPCPQRCRTFPCWKGLVGAARLAAETSLT